MFDLTKKDKKIARIAIDKGLDVEYKLGLEKAEKMIAEWRNGKLNNKDAYLKLYRVVDKHDDQIARRYNGLRGSRYLITVASIFYDGYITEEDVKDFSDGAKEQMNRWIQFWKSNK